MLSPSSYLDYLETLVVSMLDERRTLGGSDIDIEITDPKAGPSMAGFSVSPINAQEEIAEQRAARQSPS